MFAAREPADIDRFFRGLTEYAFHARLGVVDPPLVDYVAGLLVRFLRIEKPSILPTVAPDGGSGIARMLAEAQTHPLAEAREEYRLIGDATLFWSGLYPEAVRRLESPRTAEPLIEYREAGRRAYWLASTLEPEDAALRRGLLARLAVEYDLCVAGLGEVRRAWGEAA